MVIVQCNQKWCVLVIMVSFIDTTLHSPGDFSPNELIQEITNEPLDGINWWNPNNFGYYLRNLHLNPWDLLNELSTKLKNKKIIIDVKNFQLNKYKSFSDQVINNFFSELKNKENFYIKMYDPLNDVNTIEKIIIIANTYRLKIIGGIFLRPEMEDFPHCHIDLIKLYKKYNISYLSLLEPLGLLKQGDIITIKSFIDEHIQTKTINLSAEHTRFNQVLLVNEAINCGINEIEFEIPSKEFGKPSIETIIHSLLYTKTDITDKDFLFSLLPKTEFKKNGSSLYDLEFKNYLQNQSSKQVMPLEVIQKIVKMKYITNLKFETNIILDEIKQIQRELGNPPLIDPFLTIIISQAIFKLQNNNKGIKTLDLTKFLSGYWGLQSQEFLNESAEFNKASNILKSKSNIFKPVDTSDVIVKRVLESNSLFAKGNKEKLLFIIAPEESEYFFADYPNEIKFLDFSDRVNIAKLMKAVLEQEKSNNLQFSDHLVSDNDNKNLNDFKWRYVSRLFQIGRF